MATICTLCVPAPSGGGETRFRAGYPAGGGGAISVEMNYDAADVCPVVKFDVTHVFIEYLGRRPAQIVFARGFSERVTGSYPWQSA